MNAAVHHAPVVIDDGRHDFDFLHGRWQIRNERLHQRLVGSDDWETFEASQVCQPVLGGLGNIDDFVSQWQPPGLDAAPGGRFIGMSLRLFQPESRQWSIYWAGNHDGVLDAPVIGRFEGGVGTFYGHLEHEGRPVLARFTWDAIGANAAHWQQAFSLDGGRSWETNWHMWFRRLDDAGRLVHDDAVIELRQYTLQPGRREDLVALFEREFIEPQEAVGMHLLGQFRDLDAPDRLVWLRGFADMPARAAALTAFYDGPSWRRHRDAANATLLDNDDVLLLRPARPGAGFAAATDMRPGTGRTAAAGVIEAGICALDTPAPEGFLAVFEQTLAPRLQAAGAELIAIYLTEPSANTYPRLPVREGEPVLVWFARFADVDAHHRYEAALVADAQWREVIARALMDGLRQPPQRLRLAPTPRSELRA
ncbi:NIPSNAP family protein [Lysobacter cavernae]|uniref:NIPSNAP family protein n=1 Tax=Lysobacter cavernae TaxID=1685901 RepID=A0ABV7RTW6_9GAMM